MERGSALSDLFMHPVARNPWRTHHFSNTNYQLVAAEQERADYSPIQNSGRLDPFLSISNKLLPHQVERCRTEAERCIAAAERCRAAASSLEYTPCTEAYNAGDKCIEQLENVSLPGHTFNGKPAAGSSSGHRNTVGHVLPVVGAFAVQCARCLKWRLMPSKAKYEEIRERILECPFLCEDACPWRPDASCGDPADIEALPNENYLWAMDKPNISVPPPGWDRQFIIRSRGASKLGDIYYISPCGKKLRSMVEVDRFLNEHPHYVMEGVSIDRFSYKTPKPLFEGYVGGKHKRSGESDADGSRKMRGAQKIERDINTTQVKPFARRERGESSSMFGHAHFDGSECKLTDQSDIGRPLLPLFPQFLKKKRSIRMRSTGVVTTWNM